MAYQQVRNILESVRRFHGQLRRELEEALAETKDPRTKFLMRSVRRGEQEMDLALAKYKNEGEPSVLETWIQYVPSEEVEMVLLSEQLPTQSSPEHIIEWKRDIDSSLVEFYRQLAHQVSAPRTQELFSSLAAAIEQRLADQTWQARDEDLAPEDED